MSPLLHGFQAKAADPNQKVKLNSLWYEATTSKNKAGLGLVFGILRFAGQPGGSVPGYGTDPEWWLAACVLLAMLPYVPIAGSKPKCRVQSPRLQMQTAVFGYVATNLDFIHCQQELKPETALVCATRALIPLFNCGVGAAADGAAAPQAPQVATAVPLKHPLKQIQVCPSGVNEPRGLVRWWRALPVIVALRRVQFPRCCWCSHMGMGRRCWFCSCSKRRIWWRQKCL